MVFYDDNDDDGDNDDDDDDGGAVMVDNDDDDGDARWYDCLEIVLSHKKGPLLWLLYFE